MAIDQNAVLQYIGARYVPKFYENPDTGDATWKSGVAYEGFTVVTYQQNSYTSKIPVPATVGDPASNGDYWVKTADWNAQLDSLQQEVGNINNDIENIDDSIEKIDYFDKWNIVQPIVNYDLLCDDFPDTPYCCAITSDNNNSLYVLYADYPDFTTYTLYTIDRITGTILDTTVLENVSGAHPNSLSYCNGLLYICKTSNKIEVVNATTHEYVKTITLPFSTQSFSIFAHNNITYAVGLIDGNNVIVMMQDPITDYFKVIYRLALPLSPTILQGVYANEKYLCRIVEYTDWENSKICANQIEFYDYNGNKCFTLSSNDYQYNIEFQGICITDNNLYVITGTDGLLKTKFVSLDYMQASRITIDQYMQGNKNIIGFFSNVGSLMDGYYAETITATNATIRTRFKVTLPAAINNYSFDSVCAIAAGGYLFPAAADTNFTALSAPFDIIIGSFRFAGTIVYARRDNNFTDNNYTFQMSRLSITVTNRTTGAFIGNVELVDGNNAAYDYSQWISPLNDLFSNSNSLNCGIYSMCIHSGKSKYAPVLF